MLRAVMEGDTNGTADVFVRDTQAGITYCASRAWFNKVADGNSLDPAISADGRFVAFSSDAANIGPVNPGHARIIYVRNTQDQSLDRVSLSSTGGLPNGGSQRPVISADGRRVAFQSEASNLVSNDTNGSDDVFLWDRQTGLSLVSTGLNGAQSNDFSSSPSISPDGAFVAFTSDASNLVPGDTNNAPDVFLVNTAAGKIQRASVTAGGMQANNASGAPSVAAGAQFVAFHSYASNLVEDDSNGYADVFVRPVSDGATTRVSARPTITQGNQDSVAAAISADGRTVAFESAANNLVHGDTNGVSDVFVRTADGAVTRVSISTNGAQADKQSLLDGISADGRYVLFTSEASNLAPGDTNGVPDVFVRDTVANTTVRVSVESNGAQGNGPSLAAVISPDGRYVVFTSEASNLVPGDINGVADVFLRDRGSATTVRLSVASDGSQGDGDSGSPAVSADRRFVAFTSSSTNLVAGDTNGATDVFLRDLTAHTTTRISVAPDGTQANGSSDAANLNADGRFIAFTSNASNLVPDDANAHQDVFVRDTATGATKLVSVSTTGVQTDGPSFRPRLSADGRYVAFDSGATNLVPDDTNGAFDVFLRDVINGKTARVSLSTGGTQGNGTSAFPSFSADGFYVAFMSYADNLAPSDTNDAFDIFVRGPLPWEPAFSLADAAITLRAAGGLSAATAWDLARSDVRAPDGLDLLDAVAVTRAAAGLAP